MFFHQATDHATKKPSLLILVCICTHLSIDFCFKTGPKFQIYSNLNSYIPSNYIFRKPCVIDLHASQSVDMMNFVFICAAESCVIEEAYKKPKSIQCGARKSLGFSNTLGYE